MVVGVKKTLVDYAKRRNVKESGEPAADISRKKSKQQIFVVQKHDASRLHYDVRLEIDGVLVSWAVPKGPSNDPKDKRLAIRTDDHPLEYAKFEGIIPEGNYGAGTVQIWDEGTYKNIKSAAMSECLRDGRIEVEFSGKKLHGVYAFIKTNLRGGKNNWLMVKVKE